MQPHSIVVVSLHSPKEKVWGELLEMSVAGVSLRGIDLGAFDDFEGQSSARRRCSEFATLHATAAYRTYRARRASGLDFPSLAGMDENRSPRALHDYMALFAWSCSRARFVGRSNLSIPTPIALLACDSLRFSW